jgi:2-polyprenyl-3-methyl-5-hydroxy-6-metoxy-1,4-benzoquinol methylase
MTTKDLFSMTDKLDTPLLDVMVTRLEARGQHPFFAGMLQDYLNAMEIDSAGLVLDMGCGTGVAARQIAGRGGFSGQVVGIDLSPYLIEAASRLAGEEGLASQVDFRTGNTHSLEIPDSHFDAVVAHTLLSHVDHPLEVVKEAARVVKPGGRVTIFDVDFASLTFDQEDPVKGKADDEALIRALVANPRVMRQMPRLLRMAGLELVSLLPYVLAEAGKADFWASGLAAYGKLVPATGLMTQEYADEWITGLLRDSEEGVFFGASNFYGYVARRR